MPPRMCPDTAGTATHQIVTSAMKLITNITFDGTSSTKNIIIATKSITIITKSSPQAPKSYFAMTSCGKHHFQHCHHHIQIIASVTKATTNNTPSIATIIEIITSVIKAYHEQHQAHHRHHKILTTMSEVLDGTMQRPLVSVRLTKAIFTTDIMRIAHYKLANARPDQSHRRHHQRRQGSGSPRCTKSIVNDKVSMYR